MVDHSHPLIEGVADRDARGTAVSFACVAYLVGYAGYCFEDQISSIRYLTYIAPLILFAAFVPRDRSAGNSAAVAFLLAYLAMSGLGWLAGVRDDALFASNSLIIALSILSLATAANIGMGHIRALFLCSLIYFVVAYWLAAPGEIRLYQIFKNETGSGLESGFDDNQGGLLGPIYAVFFYGIGSKIQFALALAESFLGGKRIGVVAIIAGVSSAYAFNRICALHAWRNRFILLLGLLAIINVIGCNLLALSELIYRAGNANVPLEEIMLGRHLIGAEMTRALSERPLVESLFGAGAGGADAFAALISGGALTEPHNDWLKIIYDYGIVGSAVMTAFFAAVFSTSAVGAALAIANATIMMTDNVLIYLYYQFPIALMAAYSASKETAEKQPTVSAGRLARRWPTLSSARLRPTGDPS